MLLTLTKQMWSRLLAPRIRSVQMVYSGICPSLVSWQANSYQVPGSGHINNRQGTTVIRLWPCNSQLLKSVHCYPSSASARRVQFPTTALLATPQKGWQTIVQPALLASVNSTESNSKESTCLQTGKSVFRSLECSPFSNVSESDSFNEVCGVRVL